LIEAFTPGEVTLVVTGSRGIARPMPGHRSSYVLDLVGELVVSRPRTARKNVSPRGHVRKNNDFAGDAQRKTFVGGRF
jgi:hypothetical protein